MSESTEQKNDAIERGQAFLKEYKELVDKHKVDFATYPIYQPDGNGGFRTVVQSTPIDISNQGQPSPFVATEE